ncbi:MAG: hypothetical protein AAF235_10105, partial [Planctomycetota bacterium]
MTDDARQDDAPIDGPEQEAGDTGQADQDTGDDQAADVTGEAPEAEDDADTEAALEAVRQAIDGVGDAAEDESDSPSEADAEAEALMMAQLGLNALGEEVDDAVAGSAAPGEPSQPAGQATSQATPEAAAAGPSTVGPGKQFAGDADASPFTPPMLSEAERADESESMELLGDVDLQVTIELGRTRMLVEDVLKLGDGA